jgi:hypothetical protein
MCAQEGEPRVKLEGMSMVICFYHIINYASFDCGWGLRVVWVVCCCYVYQLARNEKKISEKIVSIVDSATKQMTFLCIFFPSLPYSSTDFPTNEKHLKLLD